MSSSNDKSHTHNNVAFTMSRERSFVKNSNSQNINKRRSLAFNFGNNQQLMMRSKPSMDNYTPSTLSYNSQNSPSSTNLFASHTPSGIVMQTHTNLQTHLPYVHPVSSMVNIRQAGCSLPNSNAVSKIPNLGKEQFFVAQGHATSPIAAIGITQQIPLINSPSSGNILQQAGVSRVKFADVTQKLSNKNKYQSSKSNFKQHHFQTKNLELNSNMPLQRSKSLSSADTLTRGIACLGLVLGNEITDIGHFDSETQALIDSAIENPNNLTSRNLMEITSHFIKRAVEGRRYALPISRLCLNIIAREQNETFLEALLNNCRQWYQERERLLYAIQGMKTPSRLRFTAFMAFLTEMFCQLKRRQLQLRTQYEGAPPSIILLTLLCKCCEEIVNPPIRSLSEIECLFYVLTCIGQDLEMQLPQKLQGLLSMIRDAFLNANDSPPSIRRTLLQLIELQASHWQLPGNTVLYYYPSAK